MRILRTKSDRMPAKLPSPLAISALLAFSGPAIAGELTIDIAGVEQATGKLMVQLLPSAEAMAGDGATTAALILPAAVPVTRVMLGQVPEGRYAIRVMHDLDGDGELASNLVGMPTEPWGFSNGAEASFGPPSFDDAAFTISDIPLSIEITLNH